MYVTNGFFNRQYTNGKPGMKIKINTYFTLTVTERIEFFGGPA